MDLWKRDAGRFLIGVVIGMAATLAYFWQQVHP